MSIGVAAVLIGAVAGGAVVCVIVALLRPAPVNVAAAVAMLDDRHARGVDDTEHEVGWWPRRLRGLAGYAARSSNRWWGIPPADLDILDLTPERYVARRVTWAAGAAASTIAVAGVAWFGGIAPSGLVVVLAVLIAAVLGSVVPVLAVREDAARARDEFRRATASYLDLVAQERATGRAPAQALSEAAEISDSWVFARIGRTLGRAMRAGQPPWEALSHLGKRMGVTELADLAAIAATAADGAAVYTSLITKASALRSAALAADKAEANARSQRLALPVALLLIAFLLLVMYPAMIRLLIGGT
ncbi:pilus assembly protein TadB [Prauserella marina]|uniref:Type II secretion system (T2SS), protein F n=1 Tax=Prauserella marina TaxID=530584 RepID=A0A222VRR6_9PSEU|nr:type II secretion system F family protein [Prauserella marina]ASR36607.1 pilus assembly protein TadB [Prauserella marina]PWV74018.1 type II secretion system (T2SS) protein F [Prauserella marina]SDD61012.1 Type II secretion system (T2SS), protein F [Prauserella marina]